MTLAALALPPVSYRLFEKRGQGWGSSTPTEATTCPMTKSEAPKGKVDRVQFTDRYLKSLKATGERYEKRDIEVPALRVRVSKDGTKRFVLAARFPGKPFTRTPLGQYPDLSLASARDKARNWRSALREKRDPVAEQEAENERKRIAAAEAKAEKIRQRGLTFRSVAERYIEEATPKQRQGRRTARDIRNTLIARWGDKPIAEVSKADISALLVEKRKTPAHARNLFILVRGIFDWALRMQELDLPEFQFGLTASPADSMRPETIKTLLGSRKKRESKLSDEELAAFWRATAKMPKVEGLAYRMLALSGLRLNEVAKARWSEFDLKGGNWVLPKERMKGAHDKAKEHLVPLTAAMLEVLATVDEIRGGEFVFARSRAKGIALGTKAKRRLDQLMQAELKAVNPKATLPKWVNHDLRRTCRSTLSKLKVPTVVAELVLSHQQKGIIETYDRHDYRAEKLEALELWNKYLIDLGAEPAPSDNVVKLKRTAA